MYKMVIKHVNNVIIIVNNVNLRVFAVVANTAIFCMREIANNFVQYIFSLHTQHNHARNAFIHVDNVSQG